MPLKYLYIDDEEQGLLEPLTQAISADPQIEIAVEHPSSRGLEIDELSAGLSEFNGLILDWRLDDIAMPDSDTRYPFSAGALAQELRTKQTEGQVIPIPIVLWSTEEKLRASYLGDQTGHDLFDAYYFKSKIAEEPSMVQNQLLSLASGYLQLNELSSEERGDPGVILQTEATNLDTRLMQHLRANTPAHEHTRFILKEMIERPGLLIGEQLLAARLGIEIEKSGDWERLLNALPDECSYQGPFREAWPRWWAKCVEQSWWRSLNDLQGPLSALEADERVARIIEQSGLKQFTPTSPIRPEYGKKYYAICEYYKRPLDPIDGVIIDEPEPEPWQDRRYLSLDAALERRGEDDDLFPHVTEKERLSEIRKARTSGDE